DLSINPIRILIVAFGRKLHRRLQLSVLDIDLDRARDRHIRRMPPKHDRIFPICGQVYAALDDDVAHAIRIISRTDNGDLTLVSKRQCGAVEQFASQFHSLDPSWSGQSVGSLKSYGATSAASDPTLVLS